MKPVEAMVLLTGAIVGVVLVGRRLRMPYPIALVIGGLGISLVPGLPVVRINPDLVFLLFLPPLLYAAGWFTSWHEFKANLRPIFLLAFGLVLFTTFVVGVVLHALLPAIPLAVAFAFGAIVSPPDAVAATAIADQIRLPKRIVAILEGESLVNDATGLVALRFALAAAASGAFSAMHATVEFAWVVTGGLGLGLVVAMVFERVFRLIKDDSLLITVSLLIPYVAYLPAERLHVSGVLAAVTAGIYGGWKGPELLSASTRLNAVAVWGMLVFLLNCVLFILIGLQLPEIVGELGQYSTGQLIGYGALVSAVVVLVRPVWVFPATWLPRLLSKRLRQRDPIPSWRYIVVVAWSGMRGVVSLAAALALPITFSDGRPLPQRSLVIFLTFCVILSTLVCQGLSLPLIVRWLGVRERHDDKHERNARLKLAHAALARLNKLAVQSPRQEKALQQVTAHYQERIEDLNDDLAEVLGWSDHREHRVATSRLRLESLEAERHELIRLRREHQVNEELMHLIEHELDLEEARLRS
ncbi:MAG TPA: Na+/H+ antiporter [Candidatus Acidoferrum sp.]|jgi:Na+/H+ antiporter|nr:Na+/H+ antiporter [Candidatus Acidoferrum sp.]